MAKDNSSSDTKGSKNNAHKDKVKVKAKNKSKNKSKTKAGGGQRDVQDDAKAHESFADYDAEENQDDGIWSSDYFGLDAAVSKALQHVGSKRDPTTKTKALQELLAFFGDPEQTKPAQAEALNPLIHRYCHKLHYDPSPTVRATALACLHAAHERLPKAFNSLVTARPQTDDDDGGESPTPHPFEFAGMIFCSKSDSAAEVRSAANAYCGYLRTQMADDEESTPSQSLVRLSVWTYVRRILSYGKPNPMYDALFATKNQPPVDPTKGGQANNNGGKGKKQKQQPKEEPKKKKYSAYKKFNQTHGGKSNKKKGGNVKHVKASTLNAVTDTTPDNRGSSRTLNEAQREELEEDFERIVSMAISGIQVMLSEARSVTELSDEEKKAIAAETETGLVRRKLYKMLSSAQSSIRRNTYSAIATCCQVPPRPAAVTEGDEPKESHATYLTVLVDIDRLSRLLAGRLMSEQEPTTVSVLLELVLSYLVFVRKSQKVAEAAGEEAIKIDMDRFHKALTKLLSNTCHGAFAPKWAPTLMPLVSLFVNKKDAASLSSCESLLTSAWEGAQAAISAADTMEIALAVAESASLILSLKFEDEEKEVDADAAKSIVGCWLQTLNLYLNSKASGGSVATHRRLGEQLAVDLTKLGNSSMPSSGAVVSYVEEWFWNEGTVSALLPEKGRNGEIFDANLAWILNQNTSIAAQDVKSNACHSKMSAMLKGIFHSRVQDFQGSSGSIPHEEVYRLLIALIRWSSVDIIFAKEEDGSENTSIQSIEKFIMNDLLQWTILHTSSLSDEHASIEYTKLDFELLRLCFTNAQARSVWGSFLREIVAAKCDLELLTEGLSTLMKPESSGTAGFEAEEYDIISTVSCAVLDDFAIQVGRDAIEELEARTKTYMQSIHEYATTDDDSSTATDHGHDESRKISEFLQSCAGLSEMSQAIVTDRVYPEWIEAACPATKTDVPLGITSDPNAVLETLLLLVRDGKINDEAKVRRILLESWRQGGNLWTDISVRALSQTPSYFTNIVELASNEIQSALMKLAESKENDEEITVKAEMWSDQALRLIDLSGESLGNEAERSVPSLSLIGLGDTKLWHQDGKGDEILRTCLLNVISKLGQPDEIIKLFGQTPEDQSELLITILLSLCGPVGGMVEADIVRRRNDRCAQLLTMIQAAELEYSTLFQWCQKITSIVHGETMKGSDSMKISKSVALLSQLIDIMLPRLSSPKSEVQSDAVSPDKIRAGDTVWYIVDRTNPSIRKQSKIVKVHNDLPEEIYYTIIDSEDGNSQERQTVIDRLRTSPFKATEVEAGTVAVSSIDKDGLNKRREMSSLLMGKLVDSPLENWPVDSSELICSIIAQSGLLDGRGLGTSHFKVFRLLGALQSSVSQQIRDERNGNLVKSVKSLKKLALALGFGQYTPASRQCIEILGFDSSESISALAELFNEEEPPTNVDLILASMMWGTVAISALKDVAQCQDGVRLLFNLGAKLLNISDGKYSQFSEGHFVALRGISSAVIASNDLEIDVDTQDARAESISALVNSFANKWESSSNIADDISGGSEAPIWKKLPYFALVINHVLKHQEQLIVSASRRCLTDLVENLFVENKREFASRFLYSFASEGEPIADESSVKISDSTQEKLDDWVSGLTEEETEELEMDVEVVAQWVPRRLMEEIESWKESAKDRVSEDIVRGRMMTWLAFMRIARSAASKDPMNRQSFASYVDSCKCIDTVLTLSVHYSGIGSERSAKQDAVIDVEEALRTDEIVDLRKLSALVIFRTVEIFSTLSKRWWESECPKFYSQAVFNFVEANVSSQILSRQLAEIKKASSFGDMNVSGSLVSREITAQYIQDDFTLTAIVRMPSSFPFRSAQVDCTKTLGVPEKRSKRWSLQITQMLNGQGGTIFDALMLWKENVDKEFEGIEPCPVCYSVLHVKTHKLPEMQCNTCRNCFHFDCLTQWFRSSGKNACVMCQQPWAGTRVN